MSRIAVVAIGGNSLATEGGRGDIPEQFQMTRETCRHLLALLTQGYELVITHGNGPQVGNALLRVELASPQVYPLPLDICVADTEGGMGYMIQQILGNTLSAAGIRKPVVTVITQTVVSENDPAFANPTKPIGPFYARKSAEEYRETRGWHIVEDAGRGWRRVVPSPAPREIVEATVIKALLRQGAIVIAVGGGGVPVVRRPDGTLQGVEAVIDKDLASALLATQIGAGLFLISTGVERVAVRFHTPNQQDLPEVSAEDAKRYLAEGHFPAGSMGPKIQAAIGFLEAPNPDTTGSREVIITAPHAIERALTGKAGTRIRL